MNAMRRRLIKQPTYGTWLSSINSCSQLHNAVRAHA